MVQTAEKTNLQLELERVNFFLNAKCEEAEAWKAKSEHLEEHLQLFQVLE